MVVRTAEQEATGLAHVATVSFLASRATPTGGFWLAGGSGDCCVIGWLRGLLLGPRWPADEGVTSVGAERVSAIIRAERVSAPGSIERAAASCASVFTSAGAERVSAPAGTDRASVPARPV